MDPASSKTIFDNIQPVSAFAVYATRRKNTEPSRHDISAKRRCLTARKKAKLLKTASNANTKIQLSNTQNIRKVLKIKTKKKMTEEKGGENNCKDKIEKVTNNSKFLSLKYHTGPFKDSRKMFRWLICPYKEEDFLSQNWQKLPLRIKRNNPSYYSKLMSTPLLHEILKNNAILFNKEIDIVNYVNGVREDHNPDESRALPSVVWNYYDSGCSVRMCNPEAYIPELHKLSARLQEVFDCSVRSNWYLTPPNSQGFAPHYDDVEAFILQIEGKKRWKLYNPRNKNEYLPRYSSENFKQSEIGEPILDTIIEAGDMLYLPRGVIHQAMTFDNSHSLHLTLSVYQKNSYYDFLSKLLPHALEQATEAHRSFRKGLPLGYLKYCGLAYPDNERKTAFKERVKELIVRMIDHIDVDRAADLMARSHIHDFYPPVLKEYEKRRSVVCNGAIMKANGIVENITSITLETNIRLLRYHCIRLVKEDNESVRLYYSTENSMHYHEYEQQFFEFDEQFIQPMIQIIQAYPQFLCVNELTDLNDNSKIDFVTELWEKNIIITDLPLDPR